MVRAKHLFAEPVEHRERRIDHGSVALAVNILDLSTGRVLGAGDHRLREPPLLTHPKMAALLAVGRFAKVVVGIRGDHRRYRRITSVERPPIEVQALEVVVDQAVGDREMLFGQFLADVRLIRARLAHCTTPEIPSMRPMLMRIAHLGNRHTNRIRCPAFLEQRGRDAPSRPLRRHHHRRRYFRHRSRLSPAGGMPDQALRHPGRSRRDRRHLGPVPLSRHPLGQRPLHLRLRLQALARATDRDRPGDHGLCR